MRKGIVVIHGIGPHAQAATLLDIGQPLLDWVDRWVRHYPGYGVRFTDARLAFGQAGAGTEGEPSHVRLQIMGPAGRAVVDWLMAEAWWAYSVRQPGFPAMVGWGLKYVWRAADDLVSRTHRRMLRFGHLEATDPGKLGQAIDVANSLIIILLYLIGMVIGIPFLLALFVIAQIPIAAVQDFVVVRVLRSLFVINIAQFKTYLEDEVQAANIRGRVESVLEWLANRCDELYVIAHSEGAVVAFDTLAHSESPAIRTVRKFFSLGAGLNKCWLIEPEEPRLRDKIPAHVHWIDFWASYDLIPGGPLDPPPGVVIYDPPQQVADMAGPPPDALPRRVPALITGATPVSAEVTNRMEILGDHGGYWNNDEQVLSRVAQEIDRACFWWSHFRVSDRWQAGVVKWRRQRVAILVGIRLLALGLGAMVVSVSWPALPQLGQQLEGMADPLIPSGIGEALSSWGVTASALAGRLLPASLQEAASRLAQMLSPFSTAAATLAPLLVVPVLLIHCMLGVLQRTLRTILVLLVAVAIVFNLPALLDRAVGIIVIAAALGAVYYVGAQLVWERWERREREESMRRLARARSGDPQLLAPLARAPRVARWSWAVGLAAWMAILIGVALYLADVGLLAAAMIEAATLLAFSGLLVLVLSSDPPQPVQV